MDWVGVRESEFTGRFSLDEWPGLQEIRSTPRLASLRGRSVRAIHIGEGTKKFLHCLLPGLVFAQKFVRAHRIIQCNVLVTPILEGNLQSIQGLVRVTQNSRERTNTMTRNNKNNEWS